MQVKKSTLTSVPYTALEAMFSGRHHVKIENEEIYLDRDPKIFQILVQYLRNDKQTPIFYDLYTK